MANNERVRQRPDYKGMNEEYENPERPRYDGKIRKFVHTPFTVIHEGVHVSCDEHGKLSLSRDISPDEEDRIEGVPASLIFKLAVMLDATRKTHWVKPGEV